MLPPSSGLNTPTSAILKERNYDYKFSDCKLCYLVLCKRHLVKITAVVKNMLLVIAGRYVAEYFYINYLSSLFS